MAIANNRPAVVFLDDGGWDCFFQLGAGLKRSGIRTIRITTARQSKAASLLVFDRTIHVEAAADLAELAILLEGEQVIDLQLSESVSVAASSGIARLRDRRHIGAWTRRIEIMDKVLVAERLRQSGLFTPAIVTGPVSDAADVINALGLPVVRKPRIGSGGEGISVIWSRQELQAVITRAGPSDAYFFEQFIEGTSLQFGGVFDPGGADVVVTYETLERRGSLAPASEVRLIEDPVLVETGRAIVAALGVTGIMNVNVIRDVDGRDWIHDVNPRVFGSFMAFRPAGIDLLQSYVNWVSARIADAPRPETPLGVDGARHDVSPMHLAVFPAAFRSNVPGAGRVTTLFRFLRTAVPYLRWVGARYVLYETGRQLLFMLEGAPRLDPGPSPTVDERVGTATL